MKHNVFEQTLACRAYQDPEDLERILALVRQRPIQRLLDYPSLLDLRELFGLASVRERCSLWLNEQGELAGYAVLNGGQTYAALIYETAPHAPDTLQSEILTWGEGIFHSSYTGQAQELTISAHGLDLQRIACLEAHGFRRESETVLSLVRSLDAPLPAPRVPAGYTLRTLRGKTEVEAWVELHRAAFGTQNMSVEYRLAMMDPADYDPDLDLVAESADGMLAAYVFGAISQEENALSGLQVGHTDPVATHPAHQGRGLARALLTEGLRRLQQRHMRQARLTTSSENHAMQAAARAAGFAILSETLHFSKPGINMHQANRLTE